MALFCAGPAQIVSEERQHLRIEKVSQSLFATTVAQCRTASCSTPPWLKECSSRKKVTTCAPKKPLNVCSPPLWPNADPPLVRHHCGSRNGRLGRKSPLVHRKSLSTSVRHHRGSTHDCLCFATTVAQGLRAITRRFLVWNFFAHDAPCAAH